MYTYANISNTTQQSDGNRQVIVKAYPQSGQLALLPADQQVVVTRFRSERQYLALANASTWTSLELIMYEVLSGNRPMPTGYSDIESDLPILVRPN